MLQVKLLVTVYRSCTWSIHGLPHGCPRVRVGLSLRSPWSFHPFLQRWRAVLPSLFFPWSLAHSPAPLCGLLRTPAGIPYSQVTSRSSLLPVMCMSIRLQSGPGYLPSVFGIPAPLPGSRLGAVKNDDLLSSFLQFSGMPSWSGFFGLYPVLRFSFKIFLQVLAHQTTMHRHACLTYRQP